MGIGLQYQLIARPISFRETGASSRSTANAKRAVQRRLYRVALWLVRPNDRRPRLHTEGGRDRDEDRHGVDLRGFAAKSLAGDLSGAAGRLTGLADAATNYSSAGGFVMALAGGGLGFISLPSFDNPGEQKALEILNDLTCNLSKMYSDIQDDPPLPDYTSVAPPVFSTIPDLGSAGANALALALDNTRVFGFRRARSVRALSGSRRGRTTMPTRRMQANAVADFGRQHVDSMTDAADALRAYVSELDANPDFAGPVVVDQARLDALCSVYGRVRASGFTAGEIAADEVGRFDRRGRSPPFAATSTSTPARCRSVRRCSRS